MLRFGPVTWARSLVAGFCNFFSRRPTQVPGKKETFSPKTSIDELKHARASFRMLEAQSKAQAAQFMMRQTLQAFRPSRSLPTLMYHDGFRWVCSYGVAPGGMDEFLPTCTGGSTGVEAYGENPEEASKNFDEMWLGTTPGDKTNEK